jgi:hypothetical protein
MTERQKKDKSPLQRVPTRKLVAGIKRDLRQMLRSLPVASPSKPKKGKA